jgi:hypothetical protein
MRPTVQSGGTRFVTLQIHQLSYHMFLELLTQDVSIRSQLQLAINACRILFINLSRHGFSIFITMFFLHPVALGIYHLN